MWKLWRRCRACYDFAERKCEGLSVAEKEKLGGIFERAGFLELDFWDMVYRSKGK